MDLNVKFQRFDMYKDFRFRLRLDGRYVAGFSKMSTLNSKSDVLTHQSIDLASSTKPGPGSGALIFVGGATYDLEFQTWARAVLHLTAKLQTKSIKSKQKNLVIEVYSEKGQLAAAYRIIGGWVSEYTALPDLDANANAVAIQHIKIENEGWEQDATNEHTEPPS